MKTIEELITEKQERAKAAYEEAAILNKEIDELNEILNDPIKRLEYKIEQLQKEVEKSNCTLYWSPFTYTPNLSYTPGTYVPQTAQLIGTYTF